MKSGRLVIFLAMLALALGVLTATAYTAPTGPDTDPQTPAAALDTAAAQPAGGGIESLSGSFVEFDPSAGGDSCYLPGVAQTFCFRAESFTNDEEYVLNLWQRFPTNWTVTNVYVQGTPDCDSEPPMFGPFSWSFQTSPYEVNISHPREHAHSDHCIAYYCFDVLSGAGTTDALESWYWKGDAYGTTYPPHYPCSNDNYTPAGQPPCDEHVQPRAVVPFCPPYEWLKIINSEQWTEGFSITLQTYGTLTVTEIVSTALPFTLTETWDPAHLQLLDWEVGPGGVVVAGPGSLEWQQTPGGLEVPTITKWFRVEPCTWTSTTVNEVLLFSGLDPKVRSFTVNKLPPQLWIDATGGGSTWGGQTADLTLVYGNSGGFENDVMVRSEFPQEAPFFESDPPPTHVDPGGLWAEWEIAGVPQGAQDNIEVTVTIQPSLPPSTTFEIWGGVYNHTSTLADWDTVSFHVQSLITWDKTIDGVAWIPGMEITRQTSDTIEVVEVLHLTPELPLSWLQAVVTPVLGPSSLPPVYAQIETWNPTKLDLLDWAATSGEVISTSGRLEWTGEITAPATITLTKWFYVEPCTWTQTVLGEELWLDEVELDQRPVVVNKLPPVLWIDAVGGGDVWAGQPADFTLLFGNTGGFENDVWIRNDFPPTAPFVSSVPPPTNVDPNGLWAEWEIPVLPQGATGSIEVTVMISASLPPLTPIEIWDGILDHTGELRDWVVIPFQIRSPVVWDKRIDGVSWAPGMEITRQTFDTIEVVEVLDLTPPPPPSLKAGVTPALGRSSSPPAFAQIETWEPAKLHLVNWAATGGEVITEPNRVVWSGEITAPATITLTKWFHVEPCTWTVTALWEELWLSGAELEQRPVAIHKLPPALWIDAVGGGSVWAGQVVSFTLLFGNSGGFENDVMIRNDFPPTAPFLASTPPPARQDPNGLWAEWDIAGLPQGAQDSIEVAILIAAAAPPGTRFDIVDYVFDHVQHESDRVTINFYIPHRIYLPTVLKHYAPGP